MDKKTILAIGLIVLIFILTPYYYEWMGISQKPINQTDNTLVADTLLTEEINDKQEDVSIVAAENTGSVSEEENVQENESKEELFSGVINAGDTLRYIIENENYKAVITNLHGGNLEAFYLKKYPSYKGGYVNLIEHNGLDYSFMNKKGEKISLYQSNAFVEGSPNDSTYLKTDEKLAITFINKLSEQYQIKRTFIFTGGDYRVRLVTSADQVDHFMKGRYYDIGWVNGIPLTEENYTDDITYQDAVVYLGEELEHISAGKEEETKRFNGMIDWLANRNKYFAIYLKPARAKDTEGAFIRAYSETDTNYKDVHLKKYDTYLTFERTTASAIEDSLVLYLGPLDYGILKQYQWGFENLVLNKGWYERFLRPITLMILPIFKFMHQFIPNYGFVIILFSVILKLILFPLTKKSYQSMKEMQLLQPVITEIREKYKDNPQKMNQELMSLYKKYGVNPMGGCLPMLLQMPVLFALFVVFKATIQLRGQEFIFWITDLSAPDKLFLGVSLPFIGEYIHVLPILSAVSMIFQSNMQSAGNPTNKMMAYLMPVFFMFLLYNFPSGLHLYYFVFNVLSYFQQKYIKEPVPLDKRPVKEQKAPRKRKK